MIRSHFAGGVSEESDNAKRQFPKDGVRRVDMTLLFTGL